MCDRVAIKCEAVGSVRVQYGGVEPGERSTSIICSVSPRGVSAKNHALCINDECLMGIKEGI